MADRAFTVSDVAEVVGTDPRRIKHWCESGALPVIAGTDGAGTGRYRLIPRYAVYIAALLVCWADRGIPVSELVLLGRELNQAMFAEGWEAEIPHNYRGVVALAVDEHADPLFLALAIGEGSDRSHLLATKPIRRSELASISFGRQRLDRFREVVLFNLTELWTPIKEGLEAA